MVIIIAILLGILHKNRIESYDTTDSAEKMVIPTEIPKWNLDNRLYYDPYRFAGDSFDPHYRRHVGNYPYYRFGYYNVITEKN